MAHIVLYKLMLCISVENDKKIHVYLIVGRWITYIEGRFLYVLVAKKLS